MRAMQRGTTSVAAARIETEGPRGDLVPSRSRTAAPGATTGRCAGRSCSNPSTPSGAPRARRSRVPERSDPQVLGWALYVATRVNPEDRRLTGREGVGAGLAFPVGRRPQMRVYVLTSENLGRLTRAFDPRARARRRRELDDRARRDAPALPRSAPAHRAARRADLRGRRPHLVQPHDVGEGAA